MTFISDGKPPSNQSLVIDYQTSTVLYTPGLCIQINHILQLHVKILFAGGARSALANARAAMPAMAAVPSQMAFNLSRPMMCVSPAISHGFAASAAAPTTPSTTSTGSSSVSASSSSGDVADGVGEGTAVSSSALPTGKRKSRRCRPY